MKDDFKYPYAKTDDEELICIESINKDNRNDYHYYCYGCGKELVPVLGNIREHHLDIKRRVLIVIEISICMNLLKIR